MKTTRSLLAAIALTSVASLASAEGYLGANYSFIDEDDVELGALVVKGGYKFTDWAAVEGRAGLGITDDSYHGVDIELNSLYGAYFVAGLPTDSGFYPYVLAGYTKAEVEASGFGVSFKEDDSDFSYGLGADYYFSDNVAANLEFIRYMDKNDSELDAINLGVTYKF